MKSTLTCLLLTLFIALASAPLLAQDFLVTAKGDTLQGEIKPLSYGTDKRVQVIQAGKKKATYPLFQVRSYVMKGETFLPIKGPNGYTFMRLMKSGYLSVYAFQSANQINFDGTFLLKKDGEGVELPNISFEKVMKKFLNDCSQVTDKIERDELNKKDLDKIVDEYNLCVQNRTVNHQEVIATRVERSKSITAWDVLENKIKSQPDFEGKNNALEMVAEIKGKISTSQKIPNFLLEGLKSSLSGDVFKTELENALKEVN